MQSSLISLELLLASGRWIFPFDLPYQSLDEVAPIFAVTKIFN